MTAEKLRGTCQNEIVDLGGGAVAELSAFCR
jgi:hypothetical protein